MLEGVLADIEKLVRCESPSSDAEAGVRSADLVAEMGARYLGADPERVTSGAYEHLVWRLGEGPAKVLVLGHHDTVWPLGSLGTHPFSVVQGVLRGPGSFDMKTGVVMAFHAVAALAETDGVTVLITGDEELGSPTSRALIETEAAGYSTALVLKTSTNSKTIKTQRKGVSLYRVAVTGRAAHAGLEPELGVNSSVELAHQVLAIAALSDPEGGTTVTPTVLQSGTTSNTVPASASVTVDVRMWTTAEQSRVDAALQGVSAVNPDAVVEVSGGPNRPPLEASASAALFERMSILAEQMGLPPLSEAAVGGASDGNFTGGMGVPTLDGLGAVGGGAHADSEHVVVAEIPGRISLLTALIADVLGSEGANTAKPRGGAS